MGGSDQPTIYLSRHPATIQMVLNVVETHIFGYLDAANTELSHLSSFGLSR